MGKSVFELVNPESKLTVFRVQTVNTAAYFEKFSQFNCFSVILILAGKGTVTADISEYQFCENSLLTFSLYQPFRIHCEPPFKAIMVNFHPEFFCLHKHRNEVSCNGILFNNIYESPVIELTEEEANLLLPVINGLHAEMRRYESPLSEVLLSYLKILLIDASRLKIEKRSIGDNKAINRDPEILNSLKDAIEENFRSRHSPADYAGLLNITSSALNRLSKTHFNKTLSGLIAERIVTQGKRELYLTSKPVKQIAYGLGFNDEFYFSRYFKTHVGISPQFFRDTVGFDKAEA